MPTKAGPPDVCASITTVVLDPPVNGARAEQSIDIRHDDRVAGTRQAGHGAAERAVRAFVLRRDPQRTAHDKRQHRDGEKDDSTQGTDNTHRRSLSARLSDYTG